MFILKYPIWHYLKAPKEILKAWVNFLRFNWYFFSIPLLLLTLFKPWKRDTTEPRRGFDPKEWLETLAMNLLSRAIGLVIRTLVICIGLILEIIILFFGPVFLLIWLIMPIIILFLIWQGIRQTNALSEVSNLQQQITAYALLTVPGILLLLILRAFYRSNAEAKLKQINPNPKTWTDFENTKLLEFFIKRTQTNKKLSFDKSLFEAHLKPEHVPKIINWYLKRESRKIKSRKFWLWENLLRLGSIGHDWSYAYTPYLDKYSKDLTKHINTHGLKLRLISREDEIKGMEQVLSRTSENNVLLNGEPGVGRETVILGFAQMVLYGKTLPSLCKKRILELDLNTLLAGAKNYQEIQERFKKAIDQGVKAGNIILVIKELHNFIESQSGVGQVNIAEALVPYLNVPEFSIIASTTPEGLYKNLKQEPGILNAFEEVTVNQPNQDETLMILQDVVLNLERKSKTIITYQALGSIVEKTNKFIQNIPQPEKAIDALDQAFALAVFQKNKLVLEKHINQVMSQKAKIPLGSLRDKEKEILLNLENILHKRIINQELAISSISQAMRRARAGISKIKKPIGSFLFLGPTGVGKTETAKALAESYFGSEDRMIRFDMSEYQVQESLEKLIGSISGKSGGYLIRAIEEQPFSLVLLDEIEKAHSEILNLFLQVLDEGRLTSGLGKTVSFQNAIIIATSNAGSELIRQKIVQGYDLAKTKNEIINELLKQNLFRPEFLNRFDGVILFKALSREHIRQIAVLMLNSLKKRLAIKDIEFVINNGLIKKVAELGWDLQFGARPMQRVIQDKIESKIAEKMIFGEVKRGDKVEIKTEEI